MPSNDWASKHTCCACQTNRSSETKAMLVCASCTRAWHSTCHIPSVTQSELKKMWKAEVDEDTPPHIRRLSTWRCMRCSLLISAQSKGNIVDITSDSDESEDSQPQRKRVARSRVSTPAAPLTPVDVIALTGEDSDSNPGGSPIPDSLAPIEREHGLVVIAEDDDDDPTPRESSPPSVIHPQTRSLPPVETQLLPQILKERELALPAPVVVRKRPLHSKPQAKLFRPDSRKGKKRIANFVNFHLPFGYEPLPKVNLGTLDDALRKLGVDV